VQYFLNLPTGLDCVVQCFTSPPTQYRLYGRRFYRSKDTTNSIKVGPVVEGEREGTPFPQIFCWRNAVPARTIKTWENADTVAFPQIDLQRNGKSKN